MKTVTKIVIDEDGNRIAIEVPDETPEAPETPPETEEDE
jgi:hypothetical protein